MTLTASRSRLTVLVDGSADSLRSLGNENAYLFMGTGRRSSPSRRHTRRPWVVQAAVVLLSVVVLAFLSGAAERSTAWVLAGTASAASRSSREATALRGLNFDIPAAPSRGADIRKKPQKAEDSEETRRMKRLAKAEAEARAEDVEPLPPVPVLYSWPGLFRRLSRQTMKPGHQIQRKWLQKGRDQGYVTVPFLSAVRSMISQSDVNICLVSRREASDRVAKAWQEEIDDTPLFDISGEVSTPFDLDPLEPAWDAPLDALPSDEELRQVMREARVQENMQQRFDRDPEELAFRASKYRAEEDAVILRKVVEELPDELMDEERRDLVRQTVLEVIKSLWAVHVATNSTRLRWRLACTDDELEAASPDTLLRAIFVLAGEGLEFVPQQFVDTEKVSAKKLLSSEQIRGMGSEDWAQSVSATGTNVTDALKRVPPGWMTILKGDSWPGMKGRGAQYRLPKSGKRIYIEVDFLQGPGISQSTATEGVRGAGTGQSDEEEIPEFLRWLGPVAGVAALLYGLIKDTPPFITGQRVRLQADAYLRGVQRVPEPSNADLDALEDIERRLYMDFADADDAPVVLVVGGQTETGEVVLRKLISSGYHCVLLQEGQTDQRTEKVLPQGASLVSLSADPKGAPPVLIPGLTMPDSLYDAVAGIDKLVICDCDSAPLPGQAVMNVLAAWQMYRRDYAENQRAYSSKVRLFNFARQTDFDLWDLERQKPSDMVYGIQRAGWTQSQTEKQPLFIGQFFEPIGQCQLKSPILKLNFKRFSGLLLRVYNQAVDNTYSYFLRTSDFDRTRVQYEFEFSCKGSSWHTIRMPFNAFRPVRTDGVPLPEDQLEAFQFAREDVVQMGIVVRTYGNVRVYQGDRLNFFSLTINSIRAFRLQKEPQVVYVGRIKADSSESASSWSSQESGEEDADEDSDEEEESVPTNLPVDAERGKNRREAEMKAAEAEIQELIKQEVFTDVKMNFEDPQRSQPKVIGARTGEEAVVRSGLAFTLVKVAGVNDNPGGKFAVALQQAAVHRPHLSTGIPDVKSISRGDVAALVVSALSESSCVNAEIIAGESKQTSPVEHDDRLMPPVEIRSTVQENVRSYLKQLVPNS